MAEKDSELQLSNRSVGYWFKRYSDRARKAMAIANRDAKQAGQQKIGSVNVLFGLLAQPDSVACHVLVACEIDPESLLMHLNRCRDIPEEVDGKKLSPDRDTERLVSESIRISLANGHDAVGSEHLLVATVRSSSPVIKDIVNKFGIEAHALNEMAVRLLAGQRDRPDPGIAIVKWGFVFSVVAGLVFSISGVALGYVLAYQGLESWMPTVVEMTPEVLIVWGVTAGVGFFSSLFFQSKRKQAAACLGVTLIIAAIAGMWVYVRTMVGFGVV